MHVIGNARRFHVVACCALIAVAAAACGSIGDEKAGNSITVAASTDVTTTEVDPASSVTTPSPADVPEVIVIDPGSEPRTELRYALAAGDYSYSMSQRQTMSQTIDGLPSGNLDDVETILDQDVSVEVESGRYRLTTSATDVRAGDDVDPALASQLNRELRGFLGVVSVSVINDRGEILEASIDTGEPGTIDPQIVAQLESLTAQTQIAVPLPVEPVGRGAVWEVVQYLTINGIDVEQSSRYELAERQGDIVALVVTGVQDVVPGPVSLPGLPASVDASIDAWDVTIGGTTTLDLTTGLPQSEITSEGRQIFTATEFGQRSTIDQTITATVAITPK